MEPDGRFWAGKRVCITGGTGFLGWHLLRQLLPLTTHVRVLGLRPASEVLWEQLRPLDCVVGDVRDGGAVRRAVDGCDVVFHAAGPVMLWGKALKAMRDIHLSGTRQVVQALPAGARLVHTSSVTAVGAATGAEALTEESLFRLRRLKVDYVHVKREAEAEALAAAAAGRDVVVVNPAYLIGPEDYERSAMGRLCLRGWKGKMPLVPAGAMNFVDVRDAARGHLLAAERGRSGMRYILGGENLTLAEFAAQLVAVRGLPPRTQRILPAWAQIVAAWYAELRAPLHRPRAVSVVAARPDEPPPLALLVRTRTGGTRLRGPVGRGVAAGCARVVLPDGLAAAGGRPAETRSADAKGGMMAALSTLRRPPPINS